MNFEEEPQFGLVTYQKPTWFDLVVSAVLFPIIFTHLCVGLFWLIFSSPIKQAFPERDAPLPRQLIDDAFIVLEQRMNAHGFVREGKKRQLVRSREDAIDRIGYSARKYNERGLRAEFSIWLSTSAPLTPFIIPWRSNEFVTKSEDSDRLEIQIDPGYLRLVPIATVIDLYPSYRRTARAQKAAKLVEKLGLSWFQKSRA
ncbi:hypothetical protein [Erythrobacter donghaensis]|uniref:hypothetical protein n=1 Tax=Erythrobacter donghaensis TaxID=267135 RepID=UPI000A3B31C5|nr:hypothetical protein [Erythrobacter donghaensis]